MFWIAGKRQCVSMVMLLIFAALLGPMPIAVAQNEANCLDTSNVVCVDAGGNVGIGMQTPNVQLEVQGMIHTNDGLSFASRNDIGEYVKDAPQGQRWTWTVRSGVARLGPAGNGNRMVVEPGGNIGINTNTPQARLEINNGPNWTTSSWDKALRINVADAMEFVSDDGWSFGVGGLGTAGGAFRLFSVCGEGTTCSSSHSTDVPNYILTAKPGGNVGIGTTDPSAKLRVEGTTSTKILQITGGSDLAEPFAMTDADSIEPGMVVTIDPENPGKLRLADRAYDRGVAGIVSGAGGIKPGITLQQEGTLAVGDLTLCLYPAASMYGQTPPLVPSNPPIC